MRLWNEHSYGKKQAGGIKESGRGGRKKAPRYQTEMRRVTRAVFVKTTTVASPSKN